MVSIETLQDLLAIAEVEKSPYTVVEIADEVWGAGVQPTNRGVLTAYVRALAALGLKGAANRLLGQEALPGPTGVVVWASRSRRFVANVAALESRDPGAASLIRDASQGLSRYELYSSPDGNYQVLDTQAPVHKGWLGKLRDHKTADKLWEFDRSKMSMPSPMALTGLGFGWLFFKMLETTERTFLDYSCAMYVIEGDPLALAMLFHMHDLREIVTQPRMRWSLAASWEGAQGAFGDSLRMHRDYTMPGHFVRAQLRPTADLPLKEMLDAIQKEREQKKRNLVAEAAAYYGSKTLGEWANRLETAGVNGAEKLRVMGLTTRYSTVLQYSMREMQAAIEASGNVEFLLAIEPDDQSTEHPHYRMVAEFKPDVVFQLSRLRVDNPLCPENVPFFCWDQDNLAAMRSPEATASLTPLTYVAGHAAVYGFTQLGWPRENCVFCHPAGATFRYHNGPVDAELVAKLACDFSYVSNASDAPAKILEGLRINWSKAPVILSIVEEAAEIITTKSQAGMTWEFVKLHMLVTEIAGRRQLKLAEDAAREMALNLGPFADRTFRHVTLEWVSAYCETNGRTLRLYGRGWETHPTLGRWAAGVANPGEEARAIFQASRVNLQIIDAGFIHSRALDGLAAGGFFLTRATVIDPEEAEATRLLYEVGVWAKREGIQTDADLAAVADPVRRGKIAFLEKYFEKKGFAGALAKALPVWAELPPAEVAFPQLGDVTFSDAESFGRLADRFLKDDAERQRIAGEMRDVVIRSFSYTARWEQFLGAMRRNVRRFAER